MKRFNASAFAVSSSVPPPAASAEDSFRSLLLLLPPPAPTALAFEDEKTLIDELDFARVTNIDAWKRRRQKVKE
jgi:hypothetical protein